MRIVRFGRIVMLGVLWLLTGAGAAGAEKYAPVITPYVETTNERLRRYLEAEGVGVKSFGSFDMLDMFDHARIQPGDVYRKVRDCASDDADAVFIACTQVRALEVVDVLERDLGKPVYTANQCSFWKAFETLGVTPDVEGVGGALMRSLRGGASASPARKIA